MAALVWNLDDFKLVADSLTRRLANELVARKSELAEVVGVSILGNVQEAYREKARGGVGDDGIVWRDLKPATIRARLNRATAKFRNYSKATKRKKLAKLSVDGGYEIGVDTGLQINSASPGFSDPSQTENAWRKTSNDGLGTNLFIVNADTVTIAYDRSYSAAFDAQRQLIPDNIPDPWRIEAVAAGGTWADQIIQSGLN